MESIVSLLPYIQIGLSVLLIVAVLLQQNDASVSGVFGGDGMSSARHTRRGFEKILFNSTIVIGCLFAISAFLALVTQ